MESTEEPLVNETILLEKFPGKGGWTYACIKDIRHEKKNHFGWKKVRGFIDDYEIKESHLMPMGNGRLFLPVKGEIRKKINKQAGDSVNIVLFIADKAVPVTDEDFLLCLTEEPEALTHFNSFPDNEQKRYLEWIAAVRSEELKVERMARAITRIMEGKYLWQEL